MWFLMDYNGNIIKTVRTKIARGSHNYRCGPLFSRFLFNYNRTGFWNFNSLLSGQWCGSLTEPLNSAYICERLLATYCTAGIKRCDIDVADQLPAPTFNYKSSPVGIKPRYVKQGCFFPFLGE